MPPDLTAKIVSLNQAYVTHSNMESRLHVGGGEKEYWWRDFIEAGFTEADLIAVIKYLKGQIKARERRPASLKLYNLIGNLINFESDLSMIKHEKARQRPAKTDRDSVLEQTGRPNVIPLNTAKPAKEVSDRLMNDLRKQVGMEPK